MPRFLVPALILLCTSGMIALMVLMVHEEFSPTIVVVLLFATAACGAAAVHLDEAEQRLPQTR